MDDSAGKECELVIVFQSRDLSVCKRMSSCRRTGVPDQVVSSNKVIYRRTGRLSRKGDEMKERDRKERGTGMKVKKQKK